MHCGLMRPAPPLLSLSDSARPIIVSVVSVALCLLPHGDTFILLLPTPLCTGMSEHGLQLVHPIGQRANLGGLLVDHRLRIGW